MVSKLAVGILAGSRSANQPFGLAINLLYVSPPKSKLKPISVINVLPPGVSAVRGVGCSINSL